MNKENQIKPNNNKKVDKLITDFFQPIIKEELVKGYNPKTDNTHCLECGIDMGYSNRQLCGKSRCVNNTFLHFKRIF